MYLLTVDIIKIELFPDTSLANGLKHLTFTSKVSSSVFNYVFSM